MGYEMVITSVLQLVLIVVTMGIAFSQVRSTSKWNRQNATINYINNYDTLIDSISDNVIQTFKLSDYEHVIISSDEIETIISDSNQQKDLYRIVHYYEVLCIGMELGYYDKNIARQLLYADLVGTYRNIEGYLGVRRKQMNNENIGKNFENVYHRWNVKK